jgi:1,2-diacylglycerol 3-beta-galactosyltransferase
LAVGSKRVRHLGDVLRVLNHSGLPLQLAIVAGGDDESYHQLENTEWHAVTHIYNFVSNMPTMMHAADCIICKAGGLIVTEALACGLPLLLVDVLPGQEAGNADYAVKGGAGDLVDGPVAALETIYHWLDQNEALLEERARNARSLGRPRAAYEIAELAWEAASRGQNILADHHVAERPKVIELLSHFGIPWGDRHPASHRDQTI